MVSFQVEFKLDKEKLNISVINNGIATPIETVSGGEFLEFKLPFF